MEDEQSSTSSPSLKNKLKQTLCLSCCFPNNRREALVSSSSSSDDWPRLPEIRNKCRHLISRIARRHHHRRSADFSYDPLSYALNFDDDAYYLDEAPLRNFSAARVPSSPPLKTVDEAANVAEGDRLHVVIAYFV